jgi:hypothetical protein
LICALIVATGYLLLLVAESTTLANASGEFIALPLILGTIAIFSLAGRIALDDGRTRVAELELARTVAVHETSEQMPNPDSPLGGVLKEYLRTTTDARRVARSHAYAAGPVLWGTLLALAATVSWGIGLGTGGSWLAYLAIVLEWPALVLLTLGVAILGSAVGVRTKVDGFEWITPRRWRRYEERPVAVDDSIRACSWLEEFGRRTWLDAGLSAPSGQLKH